MASFLRKLLGRHNWRALFGLLRVSRSPIDLFLRQYLGTGSYPVTTRVRTPIGAVALTLHSRSDVVTLNEIFFRRDYAADESLRVAVDFGANIGIASAYFLSRNPVARVDAFEPVPANIERARQNLRAFGSRVTLHESAVGDRTGRVRFGVEPTGRYGGIGVGTGREIEVECRDAAAALGAILEREKSIDVLKIDVEGMERPILERLAALPAGSIGCIYAEYAGDDLELPGFARGRYLSIAIWQRLAST